MKELVVISGKGGTGKTSVVASFAALAEGAVLADCDVDAADLHLLLEPTVLEKASFRGGRVAVIRESQCTGCGRCVEHCRFDAIAEAEGPGSGNLFRVDPIACEGCGVCVWVCPEKAIDFPEKVNGEWFVSSTRHGPMVHARLGVAESNSGRLVTLVRQKAGDVAEAEGRDLVIIDGSPGIGCPVIASIAGASLVLVVTEPSVSGIHDMGRVLDLAAHFAIPVAVCVNKYDINLDAVRSIEKLCRQKSVPLVGKIPYDLSVTEAQLRGLSAVEADGGPAAACIREIWNEVERRLGNRQIKGKGEGGS